MNHRLHRIWFAGRNSGRVVRVGGGLIIVPALCEGQFTPITAIWNFARRATARRLERWEYGNTTRGDTSTSPGPLYCDWDLLRRTARAKLAHQMSPLSSRRFAVFLGSSRENVVFLVSDRQSDSKLFEVMIDVLVVSAPHARRDSFPNAGCRGSSVVAGMLAKVSIICLRFVHSVPKSSHCLTSSSGAVGTLLGNAGP